MGQLLRFLIFDRSYNCRLDINSHAPAKPVHDHTDESIKRKVIVPGITATYSVNPRLNTIKHRTDEGKDEDAKLIIGACYSLHSIMMKLSPSGNPAGFSWDASPSYRLLYFSPPTGWRFIALVDGPSIDWGKMREWYEAVFVPGVIGNPLVRDYMQVNMQCMVGLNNKTRAFFQ